VKTIYVSFLQLISNVFLTYETTAGSSSYLLHKLDKLYHQTRGMFWILLSAFLCAKILQIMRNDFKDYARTFCQLFLPQTFLGFVLHTAEYRIDLFYVYGIDKIAYRHLQKLRTFVLLVPIGGTNISRVVTISKIPDVQQNVIHK